MKLYIRSRNIYFEKINKKSKISFYQCKLKIFEVDIKKHGK